MFLPRVCQLGSNRPRSPNWPGQSRPRYSVHSKETDMPNPGCDRNNACPESFPPDFVFASVAAGDACSMVNPLSLLPKTNLNPPPSGVAYEQPRSMQLFRCTASTMPPTLPESHLALLYTISIGKIVEIAVLLLVYRPSIILYRPLIEVQSWKLRIFVLKQWDALSVRVPKAYPQRAGTPRTGHLSRIDKIQLAQTIDSANR